MRRLTVVTILRARAIMGAALTALSYTDSASAQSTATSGSGASNEVSRTDTEGEKTIGVGGDFVLLVPVGDLRDVTRGLLGPLVRAGYRIAPSLELTLRTGYLFGLSQEHVAGDTNLSVIPIWSGARYFFMQPGAGLYGAGELGLNVLLPTSQRRGGTVLFDDPADGPAPRFAANAGVGYVISKGLPIDIRAQCSVLNLGETSLPGSILQKTYFALGLSAGFAFQL